MNFDPFEARRKMMSAIFKNRKVLDALSAETGLEIGEIMKFLTSKNVSTANIQILYDDYKKVLEELKLSETNIFEIL